MRNVIRNNPNIYAGLLVSGFFLMASLPAFTNEWASGLVNIRADEQTYNAEKMESRFAGNVQVNYKNVLIKSSEATLELATTGLPKTANFYNHPVARRVEPQKGEDQLQANIIRIHLMENLLSAEGDTLTTVNTVAEKPVIIRADSQQFDNSTKTILAEGTVQVDYEDKKAVSDKAVLKVGENGKAERIVFAGDAMIDNGTSKVYGDKLTVMVDSGNLIAEQNVRTDVNLAKLDAEEKKQPTPDTSSNPHARIQIESSYQQYDKASQTVLATGNVRIRYDDYNATGAKATFKLKNGAVDTILITGGRPSIITQGRKVVADKIIITTNPKHFDAAGNVKTQFETKNNDQPAASTKKPTPDSEVKKRFDAETLGDEF